MKQFILKHIWIQNAKNIILTLPKFVIVDLMATWNRMNYPNQINLISYYTTASSATLRQNYTVNPTAINTESDSFEINKLELIVSERATNDELIDSLTCQVFQFCSLEWNDNIYVYTFSNSANFLKDWTNIFGLTKYCLECFFCIIYAVYG